VTSVPRHPDNAIRLARWARISVAVLIGAVAYALLPPHFGRTLRALLGWDSAVLVYLMVVLQMMSTATPELMRRRAAIQDPGRTVILFVIVSGALFSTLALVFIQKSLKGEVGGDLAFALAIIGGTIFVSWLLTHMVFALHYAHAYYGPATDADDEDGVIGGLEFPSEHHPDYWDFMYFSYIIGMTCQVSDIQISDRGIRRQALIHGIVSFFFNTIILALTINVIASQI